MSMSLAVLSSDRHQAGSMAPTSFDDAYAAHAANVHRFCISQVGHPETAADLTHETFIKAFTAYGRVRPDPDSIRTWLISIARNCCIDHHRRSGRWQRLLAQLHGSPALAADVETLVQHRAELARVTVAMTRLRPRERELVGLRVAGDLSYRQIAEVTGISEQVAKVATHRALVTLRSHLEETR